MAEFQVPSQFRRPLVQLAELNGSAVSEISNLLEESPDVLLSRSAAYESAAKLKSLPADDAQALIEAIVPLLYFKATNSRSTSEMVKEIAVDLVRGEKNLAKLSSERVPSFSKNLSKLLDLSAIAIKAKALSVAADIPRLFSEVKILSDMRPIFGEKTSEPPLGAVVLHSLRVSYAEEGREREFFVHLDSRDLKNLQDCVKRAIDKDATLRTLLERTKLNIFETS